MLKNMHKQKKRLHIIYEEQSLLARKERAKGLGTLDQTERLYIVTRHALSVSTKDKRKFPGTTIGNVVGPIALPDVDSLWTLTFEEKKRFLGDARVIVAGRGSSSDSENDDENDDDMEENSQQKKKQRKQRLNSDREPFCYHGLPIELMEEALAMVVDDVSRVQGVVDFTPGDGPMAQLCIRECVRYLGVCHTQEMVDGLYKRLIDLTWKEFKTEGSPHYKPGLVTILEEAGENNNKEDPAGGKAGGSAKKRARSSPKASASKKRAKSAAKSAATTKKKSAAQKKAVNAKEGEDDDEEEEADSNDEEEEEEEELAAE